MPTKAQLEAQIETMREEHAEEVALLNHQMETFRKKVVRVARANARTHGWCSVVEDILVKKLDLADIMPDYFAIEMLEVAGRRERWATAESFTNRTDANYSWERSYAHDGDADQRSYRLARYKADGTLVKVLGQVH